MSAAPMPSQSAAAELNPAMSAADVASAIKCIAAIFGPKAYVSCGVSVSPYGAEAQASISVYPEGLGNSRDGERFRADTWHEALEAARTWALSQGTVQREAAIRRMALLIVDLTDQHGECTEVMLVRKEFSRDQVRELHGVACERAGEMCQGAPFSVMFG